MNPYGDIDLTRYLQTEGRRRAAELARNQAPSTQPDATATSKPPVQQAAAGTPPGPHEQSARPLRQAGSLTEVLQQMGVTTAAPRGRPAPN